MDDVRAATESLLADKPELEDDLRAVLDVDGDADSWTFDDVPLDSGAFGELVSSGIVEKGENGEYYVADRSGVQATLDGEAEVGVDDADASFSSLSVSLPTIDRRTVLALTGALLFVVAMRSFSIPSVFRGDAVILSSNDPYYYRYLVEQLLARSSGPFDFSVLSTMEFRVLKGEPLFVAVLWFVSSLLGGGQYTTGVVLALYPVVSAVLIGMLLYLLAVRLTGDRRVGIAAVVMLAVIPDHALRTAVGFADHHAFDYPWLLLTAYGLVAATDRPDIRERESWLGSACIAVGITGQVLAWEAGPLLILPVGVYLAISSLMLVMTDGNPLRDHADIIIGTGVAAGIIWAVHSTLSWHTDLAASTPTVLFIGVLSVTVLAEVFTRIGLSARSYAAAEIASGAAVVGTAFVLLPDLERTLSSRLDFLLNTADIAESQSLVQGDLGLVVAPIFWFGLVLFFALPYLVWVSWRATRHPSRRWVVPCVYGWFFLLLALVQVRFSGELGAFVALFAGLGFVHMTYVVDITDIAPRVLTEAGGTLSGRLPDTDRIGVTLPDRATLQYVIVLFVLVAGIGMLFTPAKIDLTTIEDDEYETAVAIEGHAVETGTEYPENYVFSQWGRNRMYNYVANGESLSYGFARSNYGAFVQETNSQAATDRLGNRAGYVVTEDGWVPDELNGSAMGVRLHDYWGSDSPESDGLGRYRAIHATADGSIKVFEVVPGAVIEGSETPGETVTLSTEVAVSGSVFTYERTVTATGEGVYRVHVAYAGEYQIGETTVSVNESDVLGNTTVTVHNEGQNNSTTARTPSLGSVHDWTPVPTFGNR